VIAFELLLIQELLFSYAAGSPLNEHWDVYVAVTA
jgi:hypothetical protein